MSPERKRVLVVDDDESVLESVSTALEDRGYDVLTARDGTEGLVRVERDRPHLVVLDVVMPRRSGFNVLERIGAAVRRPRIIMVSGSAEDRHRQFAVDHGADRFLHKPFDVDDLLDEVDELLVD